MRIVKLLGVSGSLRAGSVNEAVLRTVADNIGAGAPGDGKFFPRGWPDVRFRGLDHHFIAVS